MSDSAQSATQLAALIATLGTSPEKVREIVDDALREERPRLLEDLRQDLPTKTDTIVLKEGKELGTVTGHQHPVFSKVLRLISAGVHVALIGPAGCGKSYLCDQIAVALGRKFGTIHGTAGASESHLQGWLLPLGENGKFIYVPAEFVTLFEEGNSIFCADEMDAFDPNLLILLNGALANKLLHIPIRYHAPHIAQGTGFGFIATMNTFGTGADIVYAARNPLDGATLDRLYPVMMEYDREFEKGLANEFILQWAWRLRDKVRALKLRRIVSTRTIMKAHIATEAGLPWKEVKEDLLTGWTSDELAKVGESLS